MDIIGMFRQMLLSLVPENLEKQMKKKGTLKGGAMYIILSSLFIALLAIIMVAIDPLTGGIYGIAEDDLIPEMELVFIVPLLIIIVPIIYLVINFISSVLGFAGCRILGGKGEFENHFYQFAIPGSGLLVIEGIVNMIPCVGDIISLALALYFIYITFLIYKGIHKLSDIRAGFLALLPALILVLFLILGILFFSYFLFEVSQPMLV